MGMPRILPMRKPDARFMGRLMVSVPQEFDGSGEGQPDGSQQKHPCVGGDCAEERVGTPPRCFEIKSAQAVEKKRVEFFLSAKKRKRVWKNVKRKGIGGRE